MKKCNKCQEIKDYNCFFARGNSRYSSSCKLCIKNHRAQPLVAQKIREYHAAYRESNRSRIRETSKRYASTEHGKAYYNQYKKTKYSTCPIFNYRMRLSNRFNSSLKRINSKKTKTALSFLGCDLEWFVNVYLPKTFFDIYKVPYDKTKHKCEINHIIPISSSTCKEDVEKLFYYTNLNLILAIDNARRSDNAEWNDYTKLGE